MVASIEFLSDADVESVCICLRSTNALPMKIRITSSPTFIGPLTTILGAEARVIARPVRPLPQGAQTPLQGVFLKPIVSRLAMLACRERQTSDQSFPSHRLRQRRCH